jgi:hypothetical protein
MTEEEEEIYRQMLSAIANGREAILAHVAHTERPLTGKKRYMSGIRGCAATG